MKITILREIPDFIMYYLLPKKGDPKVIAFGAIWHDCWNTLEIQKHVFNGGYVHSEYWERENDE